MTNLDKRTPFKSALAPDAKNSVRDLTGGGAFIPERFNA
jgi:hypothetical protein